MRVLASQFLLVTIQIVLVASLCEEPSVRTVQGVINGTFHTARNGRRFSSFFGVPYAEPPLGDLRFRSPVPKQSWSDTFLAKTDMPACPQLRLGGNQSILGTEDCLYLNVHTPQLCNRRANLLPVMLYVPGGGYIFGSGRSDLWGPEYILDKDVILITVNYRLGLLGFFSSGDDQAPGNFGIKDVVMALKWVRQNIRAFGGDPNRVTLWGHSAGGVVARYLAISPKCAGLFQQSIMMVGTTPLAPRFRNNTEYARHGKEVAKAVGCPIQTSAQMVSCLRQTPVARLLSTRVDVQKPMTDIYGEWSATVEPESEDAVLTVNPNRLDDNTNVADVPFMIGLAQYDGLLATIQMYVNDTIRSQFMENVTAMIRETLMVYDLLPATDDKTDQLVNDIKNHYFSRTTDKRENILQLTQFFTDAIFSYPTFEVVERQARLGTSPSYVYQFDYRGTFSHTFHILRTNEDIGVTHGDELTYLFPMKPERFGVSNGTFSANDLSLVDMMVDLWTSFAIAGVPTSRCLSEQWRPYKPQKNFLHITRDVDGAPGLTPSSNYLQSIRRVWNASPVI